MDAKHQDAAKRALRNWKTLESLARETARNRQGEEQRSLELLARQLNDEQQHLLVALRDQLPPTL